MVLTGLPKIFGHENVTNFPLRTMTRLIGQLAVRFGGSFFCAGMQTLHLRVRIHC